MRLVYKFNIGQNENISSLCKISNNLYKDDIFSLFPMLNLYANLMIFNTINIAYESYI